MMVNTKKSAYIVDDNYVSNSVKKKLITITGEMGLKIKESFIGPATHGVSARVPPFCQRKARSRLTRLQPPSQALEHGPTWNRHFNHLLCFAIPFNP
jgi:hypothetical protein